MNYSDNQIKKIMANYEKTKEYKRVYYNKKYHESPEVREKQRQASKKYFDKNKAKEKNRYENNKDLLKARQKYNYYKKRDRLEFYCEKNWDEWIKYKEYLINPRKKVLNKEFIAVSSANNSDEESHEESDEDSDSIED
tara:strand:+ start:188 stop:601 length:414 start_codon:yes stop_codon:yes gene_type:complete